MAYRKFDLLTELKKLSEGKRTVVAPSVLALITLDSLRERTRQTSFSDSRDANYCIAR